MNRPWKLVESHKELSSHQEIHVVHKIQVLERGRPVTEFFIKELPLALVEHLVEAHNSFVKGITEKQQISDDTGIRASTPTNGRSEHPLSPMQIPELSHSELQQVLTGKLYT